MSFNLTFVGGELVSCLSWDCSQSSQWRWWAWCRHLGTLPRHTWRHRVTVKRTTRKDVLTVHLFPKLTIPMRSQLPTLSSYSIRGPPLSPWSGQSSSLIFLSWTYVATLILEVTLVLVELLLCKILVEKNNKVPNILHVGWILQEFTQAWINLKKKEEKYGGYNIVYFVYILNLTCVPNWWI